MREAWGQFYRHAYEQFLPMQIPKAQKDRQVISRKKVNRLGAAVFWRICALPCALKFDEIDPFSQFHQPVGVERKCTGAQNLSQKIGKSRNLFQ